MMYKPNFILAFIILCFIIACSDDEKLKALLIEQEVAAKIEKYKAKRRQECLQAALDSAKNLADSIVTAKLTAVDTSLLKRPEKPKKPIIKSPLDTTPVQPILKE